VEGTLKQIFTISRDTRISLEEARYLRADYTAGRIVIYNRSSKRIFARVDSDKIEITSFKNQVTANVNIAGAVGIGASHAHSEKSKLYYRAEQKAGYTLVRNGGAHRDYTVFYIAIPTNQFFLSLDYENADGALVSACVNHPQHYMMDAAGMLFPPTLAGMLFPPTPHVYVTNEGNAISFTVDRIWPFYDNGF